MHDSILQIPADVRYVDHTMIYRIAGKFRGRKHSRIGENYNFRRENFLRLLTFAVPKDAMPPNFAEKTFVNSHKTVKFVKVFSLKCFPLYSILCMQVGKLCMYVSRLCKHDGNTTSMC